MESILRKAFKLMVEAHDGTYRKFDGEPYATHPVSVAKIVRNTNLTNKKELVVSALLHDTVEDTYLTLSDIEKEFGSHVKYLVEQLTSCSKQISLLGKKEHLSRKMLNMCDRSLLIKLADRYHNCTDLPIASDKFRTKYISETTYILDRLQERKLNSEHKKLISKIEKCLII